MLRYLREHPCVDCGEADPIVLDFDHRDREHKVDSVMKLVLSGYGWETILAEIAKCDVRCANCHRRRTAVQLGWFKLNGEEPIDPPRKLGRPRKVVVDIPSEIEILPR